MALSAGGALLLGHWHLLLATGAGALAMISVYRAQDRSWRLQWFQLRQWLNGPNRYLVLAVASGGFVSLSTYIALAVWMESESHWLASASILQGLGTLTAIALLSWQILDRQSHGRETSLNQLLTQLTDEDALKRLIAVRQLVSWQNHQPSDLSQQAAIADCLRLMLGREPESIVREAILDSLNTFVATAQTPGQSSLQLKPSVQPLIRPLSTQQPIPKLRKKSLS